MAANESRKTRLSKLRLFCRLLTLLIVCACGATPPTGGDDADFLYVWSGDADGAHADFLAVFDVRMGSSRYGQVIATVPVEGRANWPHHTEYQMGAGHTLFANGWNTGRTFVFDMSRPDSPRVTRMFTTAGGYAAPHSYARLPNGNVLTTFQSIAGDYAPPGGLVELDERGMAVRSASGAAPGIDTVDTWPYSLLVLPDIDRVVTTNTRMGTVAEWLQLDTPSHQMHVGRNSHPSHVQIWRLSDLRLLATLQLPPQNGGHHEETAEPRRLANGEIFVNTFTCGLYHIVGIEGPQPRIEPVMYSQFEATKSCAVPVVVGNFWIQPSATEDAVVAYDLSDPARPREVSRIMFKSPFRAPHWLAADATGTRIVVSSDFPDVWVMLLNIDPATGQLTIDEKFRDPVTGQPGFNFDRQDWPHGRAGPAMPHGAVFGNFAR